MTRKIWKRPFTEKYKPEVISHNLNSDARELLYEIIIDSINGTETCYHELLKSVPYSRLKKSGIAHDFHEGTVYILLKKADQDIVLEYIKLLLDFQSEGGTVDPELWAVSMGDPEGAKILMENINEVLHRCGVLYKFIYEGDEFQIEEIGSRLESEASKEALTKMKKLSWEEELDFFEKAHKAYQNGDTPELFRNCYLAIEKTLKRIVGEVDNTKDVSKMTPAPLFNFLKQRGYFPQVLGEYHKNVLESIMKANAYIAGKRKESRHESIDNEFLVLSIHQTAATLNFLIDRYIKLKNKPKGKL